MKKKKESAKGFLDYNFKKKVDEVFEHQDDLDQKIDLSDFRKEEGGTKRVNKEYFINPLK